jgi:deoxycytidylate deaminase
MPRERPNRIEWMMALATVCSLRSEDPYVQVGALAVRADWSVAGIGYNGLPSGVDMPDEWWLDRDGRRPFMIHAEINALRYVRAGEVKRIVTTHIPCASCMTVLGSYQVDEVYFGSLLGGAHDTQTIIQIATLNRIWLQQISQETLNVPFVNGDEPPAQQRLTWS